MNNNEIQKYLKKQIHEAVLKTINDINVTRKFNNNSKETFSYENDIVSSIEQDLRLIEMRLEYLNKIS